LALLDSINGSESGNPKPTKSGKFKPTLTGDEDSVLGSYWILSLDKTPRARDLPLDKEKARIDHHRTGSIQASYEGNRHFSGA